MDARFLIALCCISSFGCAFAAMRAAMEHAASIRRRRLLAEHGEGLSVPESTSGWARALLTRAWQQSNNVKGTAPLQRWGADKLGRGLELTGLKGRVTVHGLLCARAEAAVLCFAVGAVVGAVFSTELALIGGACGLLIGAKSVERALAEVARARKRFLEGHLSGALEAWCLGLRSGLSFDRSLELYCRNFQGPFPEELAAARGEWQSGLKTREQALRDLAASYDSTLFERVVESIVRSSRFGSPLAGGLEALASESRRAHRAAIEEEVMKAPVKMMVPVGTLILPSMLVLVLGPVLLELMEGF